MDNTAIWNIGRLSVEIPADCPDRAVFENVVREELQAVFGGDAERMAAAKAEFDRCMEVPQSFSGKPDAANDYRDAQLAKSAAGQEWWAFKDGLQVRFCDYRRDDGSIHEPAILGWQPGEIRMTANARAQEMERPARGRQDDGRGRGGRGR